MGEESVNNQLFGVAHSVLVKGNRILLMSQMNKDLGIFDEKTSRTYGKYYHWSSPILV
jgi:hypothetical protein